MKSKMALRIVLRGALAAVALLPVTALHAQDYPTKPIRLVVPFAPGGGTDTLARILAQKLTERFGQQVIVDNRSGAGGTIGTDIVAKANSDGYTLAMVISSHAINPSLYQKLPYDSIKDFSPVILIDNAPRLLVVHPSVAAKSLQELVALAKAKPNQLNYGSGGNGTSGHLAGELLNTMAGIKLTHVPYKGGGPLLIDLLGGQVQLTFGSPPTTLPHVQTGKLRALAVTSAKRTPLAGSLPTMQESGLPGYEAVEWNAMLAPAGTPRPIITKLNSELQRLLEQPDMKQTLAKQGLDTIGGTPEQCAAHLRAEMAKFAKIVKQAGIRIE